MSDITKVKDLPATVTTAIEALRKFAKYLVIPTGVTTFFGQMVAAYASLIDKEFFSWNMDFRYILG